MNAQHTPGLWRIKNAVTMEIVGAHENHPVAPGEGFVAHVGFPQGERKKNGSREFTERQRANAILIAAAPELLEALSALVSMYERGYVRPVTETCGNGFWQGINDARAAIAKAKGQA